MNGIFSRICCTYKTARQGLLVVTMLTFVFSVIFVGVGGVSLSYGDAFAQEVDTYCEYQCTISKQVVGCDCLSSPPRSTLPYMFFLSPSVGMIVVGILLFFTSVLGCRGAIREKNLVLSLYLICLAICIILQFGFGVAAATVSTGNAPEVEGPLLGVLGRKYREFDWRELDLFFPSGCYAGTQSTQQQDPYTNQMKNLTYSFPLCGFYGACLYNDPTADPKLRADQNACCDANLKDCKPHSSCMSGSACVKSFLSKVGAPVAVVAFLALCVELTAFTFAAIIRAGVPGQTAERGV